ncbi:uncharacterized protein [Euphorbia lathyris]|uniref:uncharacterized protein isoform X1 n=1 Tax=Euphorbia lathyris TaxID=212925 RepID=UPI0033137359
MKLMKAMKKLHMTNVKIALRHRGLLILNLRMTRTNEANDHSNLVAELFVLSSNAADVAMLYVEMEPEVEQPIAEITVSPIETEFTMAEFKTKSLDSDSATIETQRTGSVEMTVDGIKNQFLVHSMMRIISLTVLILLWVIPSIYTKKNRTSLSAAIAVDPWLEESMASMSYGRFTTYEKVLIKHIIMRKGKGKGERKDQSYERSPRSNTRRESMASSDCSMGSASSVSYGSFTTYEKLLIKPICMCFCFYDYSALL